MPNKNPLVSVLINNYNYAEFIAEAIDSALGQTYPNVEVIVVDDGSTDRSREVIESYSDRIIPIFQVNAGQGAAINTGFAASRGDLICILDSDDTWIPCKIEQLVKIWQQHPQASAVYHRVQNIDHNGTHIGKPWPHAQILHGEVANKVVSTGGWWPFAPSSALAFSRSFLNQVMDIPMTGYRICADAYLVDLAPFFGEIIGIEQPLSFYRHHGLNNWARHSDIKQRALEHYSIRYQTTNRVLREKGINVQVNPENNLHYCHLKYELGHEKT
jgi:glycosyltransferase involved in cell wall biosynthesis